MRKGLFFLIFAAMCLSLQAQNRYSYIEVGESLLENNKTVEKDPIYFFSDNDSLADIKAGEYFAASLSSFNSGFSSDSTAVDFKPVSYRLLFKTGKDQLNNNTSKNSDPPRKSPSYKGRVYRTGPKGGCYYINSNGKKTYVDRSYCR